MRRRNALIGRVRKSQQFGVLAMPFRLRRSAVLPSKSKLARLSLETLERRELLSASAVQGFFDYGGGWYNGLKDFTAAGKLLFFMGASGQGLSEQNDLWRSDGTAAGTFQIAPADWNDFTNVDGTLFFNGPNPRDSQTGTTGVVYPDVLWKTDGTQAGTVMVKEIT